MRYLTYAIMLIAGFILQSTLLELIAILGIKPNIILIIIVGTALLRGELEGAVTGFFGGLLMDTCAPFIGANAFIGMLTGYITGIFTAGLYKENPFVPVTTVFVATFVYDTAYYIINILMQGYTQYIYFFENIILREMVYNALIALPVYGIVYYINYRIELKEHFKRKFF